MEGAPGGWTSKFQEGGATYYCMGYDLWVDKGGNYRELVEKNSTRCGFNPAEPPGEISPGFQVPPDYSYIEEGTYYKCYGPSLYRWIARSGTSGYWRLVEHFSASCMQAAKGAPGLQAGGIATQPTLAMIGEAGAGIPQAEAIIPLSKLPEIAKLIMPNLETIPNITNNYFEGPWYIREEADIRKLAVELDRIRLSTMRRQGVA